MELVKKSLITLHRVEEGFQLWMSCVLVIGQSLIAMQEILMRAPTTNVLMPIPAGEQ